MAVILFTLNAFATEVVPYVVEGNPTCADLGLGNYDYKIDPPLSGTYTLVDGEYQVVFFTPDGVIVNWSSPIGIDAVIVKGGPRANIYVYAPESLGDGGLVSPINNGGNIAAISHVNFCYDYEVVVGKTAETSFDRTFSWSIDKKADQASLVLSEGQEFLVNYQVDLGSSFADSNFAVEGLISVYNPAPVAATLLGVKDILGGLGELPVDCGVSFPYLLGSKASLSCSYAASLPGNATLENLAVVETSGSVGGASAVASVDFANALISQIDDCALISDSLVGDFGSVCVNQLPLSIAYSLYVGPFVGPDGCGAQLVENTASFLTDDLGLSGADSWIVNVEVQCATGCSLTPGYWKTHSEKGPAPFDDTWSQLLLGANTLFFDSGLSYYAALWQPPKGNAFFILAHAYIAAYLNGLNGADTSVINADLARAAYLLNLYDTKQSLIVKGVRSEFIALAGRLDAYNNGLIGPGHCSE